PDLTGIAVLIVAPAPIEASLLARRLTRWGAKTCVVPDEKVATAILPERPWNVILADHAVGAGALEALLQGGGKDIAKRIVLTTPAERHGLAALREKGFNGYLVKPVRAVSLAARLSTDTPPAPHTVSEEEAVAMPRSEASAAPAGLSILIA